MEIGTSAKAFLWDSLLSGNQTTGDWLAERATHREMVDNSHRLWECLFPDETECIARFPIFLSSSVSQIHISSSFFVQDFLV